MVPAQAVMCATEVLPCTCLRICASNREWIDTRVKLSKIALAWVFA
jgi:hypothetical protein